MAKNILIERRSLCPMLPHTFKESEERMKVKISPWLSFLLSSRVFYNLHLIVLAFSNNGSLSLFPYLGKKSYST